MKRKEQPIFFQSKKNKYSYQKQPKLFSTVKSKPEITNAGTIYPFIRTTQTTFSLNEAAGVGGSAVFDFQWAYSLRYTYLYYGGALIASIVNNGYDEFTPLFQQWRIKKVEITMSFTANNNTVTSAYTLPVIWIANDYTDSNSTNINTLLQYSNLKNVQLGNGVTSLDSTKYTCYPKLSAGAFQQSGTPAYWSPPGNSFIDTDYPAANLYGTKMVYDFQGSTSTSNIGNIAFYFKYFLEFKTTK